MMKILLTGVFLGCVGWCNPGPAFSTVSCDVSLIVLGAGQDAGAPQIGYSKDPGWADPDLQLWPTALGIVDQQNQQRFLFEATPRISEQIQLLDAQFGLDTKTGLGLDGIFLTHAHIGHYLGLAYLGREAAGASDISVHAMPRMEAFLRNNGPWSQLLTLKNIQLQSLRQHQPVTLNKHLQVVPILVPHRDEFSETVAYEIQGPTKRALFVPDIDSWDQWQEEYGENIVDRIAAVDFAFLDATFYDDHELPGRDMSQIPHPRVLDSMQRLADLTGADRAEVYFIHINHSNPIRDPESEQTKAVREGGYNVARRGQQFCL